MSKYIILTVKSGENRKETKKDKKEVRLFHHVSETVLHTMREGGIILPSLCDGRGKCGRCLIKFSGYAPLPTQTERRVIPADRLREGYRLACMARPIKDCMVETAFSMFAADEGRRGDVVTESRLPGENTESESAENLLGKIGKTAYQTVIAADIGTTTIAMQLLDAASGKILAAYTTMNPQGCYGSDVISRIRAGSEGKGDKLQHLIREAVTEGIRKLEQEIKDDRAEDEDCKQALLVISCNTAMGHLFMGYPVEGLGKSPFRPVDIRAREWNWNGYRTVMLPGISAFVGGDVLSGVYACGLCEAEKKGAWLFLDLGTNAEMVMGKQGRVVCTAAAAGPAFEGGADGSLGTHRIHVIASLLEEGKIDETGLLGETWFENGIEREVKNGVKTDGRDTYSVQIRQQDIRDIQLAKAAIRTGIYFLLKKLEIRDICEIERVYIAGGFGFYLSKEDAVRIGLLPKEWKDRMQTVGNTSLAGAGIIGRRLSAEWEKNRKASKCLEKLEQWAKQAECFQLADMEEFEEVYVGNMNYGR